MLLRTRHRLCPALLALCVLAACGDDGEAVRPTTPSPTVTLSATPSPTPTRTPLPTADALSGGTTTVFNVSRNAFAQPAANLSEERKTDFFVGNAFFNRNWVTAPSSTSGIDGLGPVFNAHSCSGCHFKDGRGRPPVDAADTDPSLLYRMSIPGTDEHGGPAAEPAYGTQLNPQAILGVPGEGSVRISYTEIVGEYADGTTYRLRRPEYHFEDLAFGPLPDDIRISPRTAPAMIGLGLLAAVPEATILQLADAADADQDGISGRANFVWDAAMMTTALGRFGWKANQPTLAQQSAGAFLGDIGITSTLFPDENCTSVQVECGNALNGGVPEIDQAKLDQVTLYGHFLAVPARRDLNDPNTLRGEQLFHGAGCASCHMATLHTGELAGYPELSGQTIHPYTDLLLHDMGPDLADERPDFLASGTEWRTAPLWGVGLIEIVNRHDNLLHDGRARGLAEAILWHGGEAANTREAFRQMSADDRAALLQFLGAL